MANETTTTSVAGIIQAIIAESNERFQINTQGLLETMNWEDMAGGPGRTVDFPIYNLLDASDVATVAEGTDATTNTEITNVPVSLAVEEHVIMSVLTDLAVSAPSQNLIDTVARKLGNAMATDLELDIVSNYASFVSTTAGFTNLTAITLNKWFDAIAALKGAGADVSRLVAVLSPKQYWGSKGIRAAVSDGSAGAAGTNAISDEFQAMGAVDVIAGVPILVSNQIVQTTEASGGMYDRDQALGLASKGLLNIATERNESLRGEEMVAVGRWKSGALLESLGIEVISDIS